MEFAFWEVPFQLLPDARDVFPHLSGDGKPLVVWRERILLQLDSRCFVEIRVSAVESERGQGEQCEQKQARICRDRQRGVCERELQEEEEEEEEADRGCVCQCIRMRCCCWDRIMLLLCEFHRLLH